MAIKRRAKETYTRWDPADNLKTEADIRAYLIACFEEAPDDAAYIAAALGDVARARGMTKLAKRTGLTRMGLYKALSKDGNPSLDTVLRVLHALGLRLTAKAA
jgi:probable addiction module antidote protein